MRLIASQLAIWSNPIFIIKYELVDQILLMKDNFKQKIKDFKI